MSTRDPRGVSGDQASRRPGRRGQTRSGEAPKRDEDPEAEERVRRILESPTYRLASRDVEFLERDPLRPTRLQLEYLKPELQFQDLGIRAAVVVFGGTRVIEPSAARRALARAKGELEGSPADPELRRRVAVAERILANSRYYDVARELGRIVGRSGRGPLDCRLVVMTGGGGGLMEAANRGAHDVGARSVGLNIEIPSEQDPNPYLTPELSFRFRYFALRKMHFMLRARALVAFPGGYGTLDEVFDVLCLVQTRKQAPLPVVLVGEAYWRRVFDAEFLAAEGSTDPEDLDLFWYAETAEEIWEGITRWYEERGESLLPDAAAPAEK